MIKVSYDMKVYRKHLDEVVRENDVVVELGAHVGRSSLVILDKLSKDSPVKNPIQPLDDSLDLSNGYLISLDNSPEANEPMEKIAENYENFTFINDDVRLHDCLEKVARMIDKCDVLSIDLGGSLMMDGLNPATARECLLKSRNSSYGQTSWIINRKIGIIF